MKYSKVPIVYCVDILNHMPRVIICLLVNFSQSMVSLVDMIVKLTCKFPRNIVPKSHLVANAGLHVKDDKKAAEADKKVQAKKNTAIKEQATTTAAGMTTVGADGKDTKSTSSASDSIKKNLALQSLSSIPAGSGRAAGTLGYF